MSEGMTVGSLFSGVGGFDIAAERAGMQVLWQSENDKRASEVLAHYWPEVPNHGDIHRIRMAGQVGHEFDVSGGGTVPGVEHDGVFAGVESVLRDTGRGEGGDGDGEFRIAERVDLMVGGFPCQSYSLAGSRGGLVDDRGALWWEFHRLIREGQPSWVVGENVPGLLSSAGGRDFASIVRSLVQLGYGVVWRVLDAQWFGVPQRRRRVFIVGHLGGLPRPEVLALAESLSGDSPPSRETGKVASAITRNGVGGGGGADDNSAQANHLIPYVHPPFMARSYKSPNVEGGEDVVIPISRAGSVQVRRLTPLESERLQGFPDGWTDVSGMSSMQRFRQMGNAVAVPVAEWIMKRIAESEGQG